MQLRRIHHLVDVHVHRARNRGHIAPDLLRQRIVLIELPPAHLDIDRRRKPEVQNLVHNIRRLEVEHHLRKLLVQHLPQMHPVALRRMMLLRQRHQDLPILHIRQRPIAERQVEAPVRNPDVIQHHRQLVRRNLPPNRRLHRCEDLSRPASIRVPGGVRTCSRNVPASTAGKKSCPINGSRQADNAANNAKQPSANPPWPSTQNSSRWYATRIRLKRRVETEVDPPDAQARPVPARLLLRLPLIRHPIRKWSVVLIHLHLAGQQELHHRRNQRARQAVRRQHGEHHRHPQRRKQALRRARQEHNRHKNNADRKR